jgi:hypothetical protein
MERTVADVLICAKDFSDKVDVSPDELEPLRAAGQNGFEINLCTASL